VDETVSEDLQKPQIAQKVKWLLTGALVVLLALLRTLPWNVRTIPVPEDDSWDLALNYFASHHAVCGIDYIFTFGPLGFIYNATYFPDTFNVKLMMQGLLCALTMVVLILQGKRLLGKPLWTVVWIFGILAWYGFFADVIFLSVSILLINQYFLLDDRQKPPSIESFLLVFLLALTAIVKFTFTVAAVWVIAFVAADELLIKRSKPILSAAFALLVPTLWLLSGQPLSAFTSYIATSLQVTSGHSEAMSFVESANWVMPVTLAAGAAFLILLSFGRLCYGRLERAFIPALLAQSGIFFLIFKAAYVRHTVDHEPIASSVYGFAALSMIPLILALERNKIAKYAGIGAITLMTLFAFPLSLPVDLPLLARYPALLLSNVLGIAQKSMPCLSYLAGSSDLRTRFENRMEEIRKDNQLPELKGSVDIYPVMSKVPIAYKFEYKPRPVFQSYLAYRQPLAELNKEHLKTEGAANTIIIQTLHDCYGYYPLLYDGPSWIELLSRYEPRSCHPAGLVLTKSTAPRAVRLKKLRASTAKLGERIELEEFKGKAVFAKIDVRLGAAGALQKLFFRIYPPEIEVKLSDGKKKNFIAPSEIMKAGFLLTPFAESPEELQQLFSGEIARLPQVQSFTLTERKNDFPWAAFSPDMSVELFDIRQELIQ
jgi:hypothetical protein